MCAGLLQPGWLSLNQAHSASVPYKGTLPVTGGSERPNRSLQAGSRKALLYLLSTEPKYLATG